MASKHSENIKNKKDEKNSTIKKTILIVLLLTIFGILFIFRDSINFTNDELKGIWTTDEVTIYEFDGKGKGTMRLPNSEYNFSYIIHKNQIYIDFDNDKAKDSDYEFSFENDKLILKGIKTTTGTYTFKRK